MAQGMNLRQRRMPSRDCRLFKLRDLTLIKGVLPTKPNLPIFQSYLEYIVRNRTQFTGLAVIFRMLIPTPFVKMRSPIKIRDPAARAVIVSVDRIDLFKYSIHFACRMTNSHSG